MRPIENTITIEGNKVLRSRFLRARIEKDRKKRKKEEKKEKREERMR
jgi:hypothetical protein